MSTAQFLNKIVLTLTPPLTALQEVILAALETRHQLILKEINTGDITVFSRTTIQQ